MTPTALIADDEPLLRERLRAMLGPLWPALRIVAEARNGREAVEAFETHRPAVVFLDIHMPGLDGIAAARAIARRAQVVFVTAYEQYAVQAFAHGALDYLVKPFDAARLADTVQRLQQRIAVPPPAGDAALDAALDAVLDRLAQAVQHRLPVAGAEGGAEAAAGAPLRWIRASVGPHVKLIPVEQVVYFRADEKYTLVVWEGGGALIRTTIRELAESLDRTRFAQIHRSVIVNLNHVVQVQRGLHDTAEVQLKGRPELLPVSRSFLQVFRQM